MATLLRMSEAAALALHAAGFMASRRDEAHSARALAARFRASEAHMVKVCQKLSRRGLVAARRGPGGGFVLAKNPARIRLLDVYVAIEGPVRLRPCLFRDRQCGGRAGHECVYGRTVMRFEEGFLRYLRDTTLGAVAAKCARLEKAR